MNVPFLIARHYFVSKKNRNIINIISIFAMFIVAVATAALIIVLSVFNGLEDLIRTIYKSFDPDLKISAVEGKSFETNVELLERIRQTEGVALLTEVIEDYAVLRYQDRQMIVKMKGVSGNFFEQNKIDSAVIEGNAVLKRNGGNFALIGRGVQFQLSILPNNPFVPLQFLYPKADAKFSFDPENAFREKGLMTGGVFAIERQYDDSYAFVPLDFAESLLNYGSRRTAIEVKVKPGARIAQVKARLQKTLGEKFLVQDSDEQHVSLLRAVKVEKMFVFLTFSFILLIASVNIFFALSMLVLDKKKDISVLQALGATPAVIRNIFLIEGALVAFSGAFIGLSLGILICWLQQTFGLVSMGMETAIVEAYPVEMQFQDILLTTFAIIIVTLLVSVRPARKAASLDIKEHL